MQKSENFHITDNMNFNLLNLYRTLIHNSQLTYFKDGEPNSHIKQQTPFKVYYQITNTYY